MLNKIKLKFSNHNLRIMLLFVLPLATIGLTIGGYFMHQNINKSNTNKQTKPSDPIIETPSTIIDKSIFPKIKSSDFYDLIEFKNGIPFIGDIMLAAIIKDIITRLGSPDGELKFYIVKNNPLETTLNFKWVHEKKEIKKTYIISIKGI